MPACTTHVPCLNMCYNDTCASYVAPNEVWDYDGSGVGVTPGCSSNVNFPTAAGQNIYDENLDRLAGSINDERARRVAQFPLLIPFVFDNILGSQETGGTGGTVIYGDNASHEQMKDIKTAINQISSGYVTYSTDDGDPVPYASVNEAKNKINTLRANCLCDTDCGLNLICPCHEDCTCFGY